MDYLLEYDEFMNENVATTILNLNFKIEKKGGKHVLKRDKVFKKHGIEYIGHLKTLNLASKDIKVQKDVLKDLLAIDLSKN